LTFNLPCVFEAGGADKTSRIVTLKILAKYNATERIAIGALRNPNIFWPLSAFPSFSHAVVTFVREKVRGRRRKGRRDAGK
jgi:hypothetical protein